MVALPSEHIAYRMKRPDPDGNPCLVLTPAELVERVAALIPPPRGHLTHYFGLFAPNALVAVITAPAVIERILRNLDLPCASPALAPVRTPPAQLWLPRPGAPDDYIDPPAWAD